MTAPPVGHQGVLGEHFWCPSLLCKLPMLRKALHLETMHPTPGTQSCSWSALQHGQAGLARRMTLLVVAGLGQLKCCVRHLWLNPHRCWPVSHVCCAY
jgi:hypothetical protein